MHDVLKPIAFLNNAGIIIMVLLFKMVKMYEKNIAQNAYCSRDIYFQFNKVRRFDILRAIMQRLCESASAISCQECTTKLINML